MEQGSTEPSLPWQVTHQNPRRNSLRVRRPVSHRLVRHRNLHSWRHPCFTEYNNPDTCPTRHQLGEPNKSLPCCLNQFTLGFLLGEMTVPNRNKPQEVGIIILQHITEREALSTINLRLNTLLRADEVEGTDLRSNPDFYLFICFS